MSKNVLGRGLSTLLPRAHRVEVEPDPVVPTAPGVAPPITELEIEEIGPNPFQPRSEFRGEQLAELAQSIRIDGIIQPLVVRRVDGKYQLITGERRLRAAQLAGLMRVPVHVQELADGRMLEVALVENIQREDLNPIESAIAFQRLSEELALNHEEIGRRTGKDRATITNSIRLLQLPPDLQRLVSERALTAGHARALLKFDDPERQRALAARAVGGGWSVRQIEKEAGTLSAAKAVKAVTAEKRTDPNVRAAIDELERILGTRVRIADRGKGKGTIEIDYFSPEDLDRIYGVIAAG